MKLERSPDHPLYVLSGGLPAWLQACVARGAHRSPAPSAAGPVCSFQPCGAPSGLGGEDGDDLSPALRGCSLGGAGDARAPRSGSACRWRLERCWLLRRGSARPVPWTPCGARSGSGRRFPSSRWRRQAGQGPVEVLEVHQHASVPHASIRVDIKDICRRPCRSLMSQSREPPPRGGRGAWSRIQLSCVVIAVARFVSPSWRPRPRAPAGFAEERWSARRISSILVASRFGPLKGAHSSVALGVGGAMSLDAHLVLYRLHEAWCLLFASLSSG